MQPFFVYMLRCSDGSFYVGHTDDLERRMAQHGSGVLGGYTARRRPVALVYSCELPTRHDAVERERQLKGWSRAKKLALIEGDFERLRALSRRSTAGSRREPSAQGEREE